VRRNRRVVVFLRGDHTVNLAKLAGLFQAPRNCGYGSEEILNNFPFPGRLLRSIGLNALALVNRRRPGGNGNC